MECPYAVWINNILPLDWYRQPVYWYLSSMLAVNPVWFSITKLTTKNCPGHTRVKQNTSKLRVRFTVHDTSQFRFQTVKKKIYRKQRDIRDFFFFKEQGRWKFERQNPWQQAKHGKLHSDLFQDNKKKMNAKWNSCGQWLMSRGAFSR